MPDSTVIALPAASTLDGDEVLYGIQGGANRKLTAAQIKTFVLSESRSFLDFGANGNGAFNNASALVAMGDWARAESLAGRTAPVNVPPGIYNFNHSQCFGCFLNIKKFVMFGYGAIFQNTYDQSVSGPNFGYELAWPISAQSGVTPDNGKLISTVVEGSNTVTLITPADHSLFTIGQILLVCSLDNQAYGYPPNPHYFDFVTLTAKNTTTGLLTFRENLKFSHRSDFPDDMNTGAPCGKARIFQINTKYLEPLVPVTFDIEHTYFGIEARIAPTSELFYITISGKYVRFVDCILPGVSPSVAGYIHLDGGELIIDSEPDKIVDHFVVDRTKIRGNLGFQSSSINHAIVRYCTINGTLSSGNAKYFSAEDVDCDKFAEAPTFGLNIATNLRNVHAREMEYPINHGGRVVSVNSAYATFSNGVIRVVKDLAADFSQWGVVPGCSIKLLMTDGFDPGHIGQGIVMQVYEDVSYKYIVTTLPFATLPAWSNNQATIQLGGAFKADNCTGADNLRRASKATENGKQPWEYLPYRFIGKTAQAGYWYLTLFGKLERICINVRKASIVVPAVHRFLINTYGLITADNLDDAQEIQISIDLKVQGLRDFTQAVLGGKKTNDFVTIGGIEQTALPTNRHFNGNTVNWSHAGAGVTIAECSDYELPVFDVEFWFDNGIYRTFASSEKDIFGGSVIAAITGTIP